MSDIEKTENPEILTVKETAAYLRLAESTIFRMANQGILPGAKIGRKWRFEKQSILMLIRNPEILRRVALRRC